MGCGGAYKDSWKLPESQIAETYRVVLERLLNDSATGAAISMPKSVPGKRRVGGRRR